MILYLLIGLYIFFFLKNISTYYTRINKLKFILVKFNNIKEQFPKPPYNHYNHDEIAHLIINNLFDDMPLINDLISNIIYIGPFSLNDDAQRVIEKFETYYNSLASEYSSLQYKKLSYFSLVKPIKEIFLIPSKIISWFGIDLTTFPARVFSAISYIAVFVLTHFGNNISEWLKSLFK